MSRVCTVCGKGQTTGNNVSHSKRRTRRTFKANVQKVSYVGPSGNPVSGPFCPPCLISVPSAYFFTRFFFSIKKTAALQMQRGFYFALKNVTEGLRVYFGKYAGEV